MKFIYIMKERDRDTLLKHGYTLVKYDELNHLWVFDQKDPAEDLDALIKDRYVLSSIISL